MRLTVIRCSTNVAALKSVRMGKLRAYSAGIVRVTSPCQNLGLDRELVRRGSRSLAG